MDRALGELSYPVYLTHLLVAGAFRRFAPADLFGEIVAMGSILLSLLLVRYVAAPIEALRAARSDGSVGRGPVVQP